LPVSEGVDATAVEGYVRNLLSEIPVRIVSSEDTEGTVKVRIAVFPFCGLD
jgi:hypothetical protein